MTNLVYILDFFGVTIKKLMIQIDRVAFGFIDKSYDLIDTFAKTDFITDGIIEKIRINMYVIIGIFALFRMAILLVNSILDPEKLTAKDSGITKVFFNFLMVFVFLVITPIVFDMAFEVQEKVVENNYVQRLFINVNQLKDKSPGENLKNIAIASLISIDERLVTDGKTNSLCDSKCKEAVEAYNDMVTTGFEFSTIDNYIDDEVKGEDGETIYVYDYPILISTVVGGFITYILLSFAIDIAVRVFELAILEVLAPLFIVTYIDPKSAKSGPFNKWLKAVGKTYASLFIKLGVLAIMFLFISIISKEAMNNESIRGFASIVLIIGILIFAKKAPKWLGGMFGVEGGIGGLSIGKKLKDEMLGGGALSKAAHKGANTLGGAAMGAGRMAWNNGKNRRAAKKEAREKIGYKNGLGKKAREARSDLEKKLRNDKKYAEMYRNGMSGSQVLRQAKKEAYKEAKVDGRTNAKQFGAALAAGAIVGGQAGINAKDLKGSLKASIGAANQKAASLGFKDRGVGQWVSRNVKGLPGMIDNAWGSTSERYDAASELEKNKMVEEWTRTSKNKKVFTAGKGNVISEERDDGSIAFLGDQNTLVAGQGGFNNFVSKINKLSEKTGFEIKSFDDFKVAQHAAITGVSLDSIVKDSIKIDDDGNVEYKVKDKSGKEKIVSLGHDMGGYIDPTSSFDLTMKKFWNNYQNDCLSNYTSNQQAYAQEVGVYQNAVGQLKSHESNLEQYNTQINNSEALIKHLASGVSNQKLGNLTLTLDSSSLEGIRKNVLDGIDALENADENTKKDVNFARTQEYYKDVLKELEKMDEAKKKSNDSQEIIDELRNQAEVSENKLKVIREAQNSLEDIVNNIEGVTTAEKAQKLSVMSNKIASDLKAFEAKKAEKK